MLLPSSMHTAATSFCLADNGRSRISSAFCLASDIWLEILIQTILQKSNPPDLNARSLISYRVHEHQRLTQAGAHAHIGILLPPLAKKFQTLGSSHIITQGEIMAVALLQSKWSFLCAPPDATTNSINVVEHLTHAMTADRARGLRRHTAHLAWSYPHKYEAKPMFFLSMLTLQFTYVATAYKEHNTKERHDTARRPHPSRFCFALHAALQETIYRQAMLTINKNGR